MPNISAANNEGNSRFTVTFLPTGQTVLTDPPAGHGGDGTSFAPTDLVDAALLACTGAMMFNKAKSMGIDAGGMKLTSSHTMADAPRRIGSMEVEIILPFSADERQKKSLIAAAKGCPVRNSLNPNMVIRETFTWADGSTDVLEK